MALWKDYFVEVSNEVSVQAISNFPSSTIRTSSLTFINKCWILFLSLLCPYCWNTISRATTIVNEFHNSFARLSYSYTYLLMKSGNWPKSPTKIIELPPKGILTFFGKSCRSLESFFINIFLPIKLVSSIRIYFTCFISSCKEVNPALTHSPS